MKATSTYQQLATVSKWLRYALQLSCAISMAILIIAGSTIKIDSFDSLACQSSASSQACELAALVANPDAVEYITTSTPHTPTLQEQSSLVKACEQDASFFSGRFDTPIFGTLSSVTETLPGVYLVDIQYPDRENSSDLLVRTACVARLEGIDAKLDNGEFNILQKMTQDLSYPQVFALDEIPLEWPAVSYERGIS